MLESVCFEIAQLNGIYVFSYQWENELKKTYANLANASHLIGYLQINTHFSGNYNENDTNNNI